MLYHHSKFNTKTNATPMLCILSNLSNQPLEIFKKLYFLTLLGSFANCIKKNSWMIVTFRFYISSTKASSLLCTSSTNWNTKSNLEMVWLALHWKLHNLWIFNWGLNWKGDQIHQADMNNYWLNFLHRILDHFDMNINQMGEISKVWSFA